MYYKRVNVNSTYLVAILIFSIIITFLLHCIVSQMNKSVMGIFYVVLSTTCPKISLRIKVTLQVPVYCCRKRVASDVKFAVLVKERFFHILLYDVSPLASIHLFLVNY